MDGCNTIYTVASDDRAGYEIRLATAGVSLSMIMAKQFLINCSKFIAVLLALEDQSFEILFSWLIFWFGYSLFPWDCPRRNG